MPRSNCAVAQADLGLRCLRMLEDTFLYVISYFYIMTISTKKHKSGKHIIGIKSLKVISFYIKETKQKKPDTLTLIEMFIL